MKKSNFIVLTSALTICLGMTLVSCGGNDTDPTASPSATATSTVKPSPTATPTPGTPTPTPTPKPTEPPRTVVFEDTFKDMSKWEILHGDWKASGNKLVTADKSEGGKAVIKNKSYKDFTIEADVTIKEHTDNYNAGFIVRVSEPGTTGADSYKGYYAGINQTQAVLGRADNNWTEIHQEDHGVEIDDTTTVKIKLVVTGSTFAFYVDDMNNPIIEEDVAEHEKTAEMELFSEGSVGVRTFRGDATFANLKISE